MKKILLIFAFAVVVAVSANAITYEDAFNAIKAMPEMRGVEGTEISGYNSFGAIGVTDGQLVVWNGERGGQTEIYGNTIYKLIGELPASEIIQCKMTDNAIFAIFAKPVSNSSNRIIIFSDSAYAGFTGALIVKRGTEYIENRNLNSETGRGYGLIHQCDELLTSMIWRMASR